MNDLLLGRILRRHAGLDDAAVADLNHEAVKTEATLEQVVLRRKLVTRDQLYEQFARELNVPYIDLANFMVDPELVALIPEETARRLRAIPLFQIDGSLTVAMASPDDIGALDELRRILSLEINPALADPQTIDDILSHHGQGAHGAAVESALTELEADQALHFIEAEAADKTLEQLASEAPVVRLVNSMLEQAAVERASDIHIEPDEDTLRVRMRIDGLLRETGQWPAKLHPAVVSRIKILSGMDISDKRRPQDGRFEVEFGTRQVDTRVSTFPTVHGENVVIRLLDKAGQHIGLPDLGMAPETMSRFEPVYRQPHGIILVTGPTGSGKTTTLYAVLSVLNSPEKNIVTLEDPVEYRLPLIRQCQVNPKAGVTFATGLRAILRQDPDIILVGEIRDGETAEIAFQAALTGHLVLSTLHTNDAASALTRMIDMRLEPFLISSSVIGILAQRLLRRVCERCAETYVPDEAVLRRLGIEPGTRFTHGRGCPACGERGFRGRLGVYELLLMTPEVQHMVMERRSADEINVRALSQGMVPMRDDALANAAKGLTTPEEVLRVTQD
ncbi:type II secretion system protein GspE [candidate division WOR-3 bacterium]|nr:type II secretion system protein GspE [candidate division WOR-3 bacterium]